MVTRIYANAVAKYNEGRLLDAEKIRRLIDAEFSDAVKMLCDYGYGGGVVDENRYDIDAFISGEISALIDYVVSSSPSEYLTEVLVNKFLYGNAKAYYKARYTGKLNESSLYVMHDEEVREGIEKGEYDALPKFLADALISLDSEFDGLDPDPKRIDIVLTQAMYAHNVYAANKSRSKVLVKYVKGGIDLKNISTALRARALRASYDSFKQSLIAGGSLNEEQLAAVFNAEDPAKEIRETEYDFLIERDELPSLARIEALTDDYLASIWGANSDDMQSLAPFVSYFIAKEREYVTVKMILTCIKNGARGEIADRMRAI